MTSFCRWTPIEIKRVHWLLGLYKDGFTHLSWDLQTNVRAVMGQFDDGFVEELDELVKIHEVNTREILKDDIQPRDIVELRVHDQHEATIPMVSHEGDLLWTRELQQVSGLSKDVIKTYKEARLVKLEPGTITTGLVLRKQYVYKTDNSPVLSYSPKFGEKYPVYDLLCPEGIVRFDLHGETYLQDLNEVLFVDWLYVRKLRSLA